MNTIKKVSSSKFKQAQDKLSNKLTQSLSSNQYTNVYLREMLSFAPCLYCKGMLHNWNEV